MMSETLQLDAAGACLFSYLLKAEPDGYSDGLCRACAPHALGPSHGRSTLQQSAAEPLEKFCNHWHQGTVVTAVTAFGRRGSESMVGTRTGVLPCLWCGLKGAPLYLGDSGDGDDKNHGTRLMEVLGRPTAPRAASGSLRDRLAEIRAGCAEGVGRSIQSVNPNVEEYL